MPARDYSQVQVMALTYLIRSGQRNIPGPRTEQVAGEGYWFVAEQTLIRIRQSPEKQILSPLGRVQLEGQAGVSLGAISPPHLANGCMTVVMGQSGARQIRLTSGTNVGFLKNQVSCYKGSSQCQRRASKKDFTGTQGLLTEKIGGRKQS